MKKPSSTPRNGLILLLFLFCASSLPFGVHAWQSDSGLGLPAPSKGAFSKPDSIRFGATVKLTQIVLGSRCKNSNTRRIDPPFLDVIKDRQMQIDCEGLMFRGRPRHAEFVFGDDNLKMVWIMTDPDETASLEEAMTRAYGPPKYRNEKYVGFTGARVALRLDRSEVLFYSKDAEGDVLPDIEELPKRSAG